MNLNQRDFNVEKIIRALVSVIEENWIVTGKDIDRNMRRRLKYEKSQILTI